MDDVDRRINNTNNLLAESTRRSAWRAVYGPLGDGWPLLRASSSGWQSTWRMSGGRTFDSFGAQWIRLCCQN